VDRGIETREASQTEDPGYGRLPLLTLSVLYLLFLEIACIRTETARFHWVPEDFRVKGTYYFQPRAAINNFWNAFNFEQCERDFAQLRADGFNTIILFIPWGIFQPTVKPVSYNDQAFAELDRLIRLANMSGLKVALRVGTHDHIPLDAGGGKWLAATVMTDEDEWAAFRDLFRKVAARTKDHTNLLFLFWTFEDTGYDPDHWFHQYPENTQAFRQWLRLRPLWWWNWFWWEENVSYETVAPPDQNRPPVNGRKMRSFLQFSDELAARRLPDPCNAAKQENPDAVVSFQPRVDANWGHDYSLQFELPPCYSFVSTWFSPYQSYMFGDKRKELDGRQTASYVSKHIERIEGLSQDLPVFVDQFNFQHFGGDPEEGALATESEQHEFISHSLPLLLRDTLGYALWNHQDYYLNVINNGSFRSGLSEWEVGTEPELVRISSSATAWDGSVEIGPGGYLRQKINVSGDQEYTLEFKVSSPENRARVNVLFRFLPEVAAHNEEVSVGSEPEWQSVKVKSPKNSASLSVAFQVPEDGPAVVQVSSIMLYPWVDTGGIYNVQGSPRVELRDLFRELNTLEP
jgi:hypothetical protein